MQPLSQIPISRYFMQQGKLSYIVVNKFAHIFGITCGAEELPESDFNFCDPNVRLSEIKRIFIAKTSSSGFTNWHNPLEWIDRISETADDIDTIRQLVCIADKPLPNSIRKDISNNRKVTVLKEHRINATVDEVSDANHSFMRSLAIGKNFRMWYETHGGYMFGGNDGIICMLTAEMVLARGEGEIMVYNLEAYWKSLRTEDRIESPIFGDEEVFEDTGEPLDTIMVLYPMMKCEANGIVHPNDSGFWKFGMEDAGDFVNSNPLSASYPLPNNRFKYILIDDYFASLPPGDVDSTPFGVAQTLKDLDWEVPWSNNVNDTIVYSDASDDTVVFKDTVPNTAWIAPLIILHKNANIVRMYGIAECQADQVSSTGSIAIVRLTRSHAPVTSPDITTANMIWDLPGVLTTYPDPADPTNPNKLMVEFPVGIHTIGVRTLYHSALWGGDFPQSRLYFVIQVS